MKGITELDVSPTPLWLHEEVGCLSCSPEQCNLLDAVIENKSVVDKGVLDLHLSVHTNRLRQTYLENSKPRENLSVRFVGPNV